MKATILSVLLIILLSGCASRVDKVEVQSQEIERTKLNLPPAEHLDLKEYEWFVVTPDNAEELFEYLNRRGYDPVIFGLTDQGYKNLSIDFAKIRDHINTQRNILLQYKDYYEDSSSSSSSDQ